MRYNLPAHIHVSPCDYLDAVVRCDSRVVTVGTNTSDTCYSLGICLQLAVGVKKFLEEVKETPAVVCMSQEM